MSVTQEQKDIVEIKGEVGRIRHHQDLQKIVNEQHSSILQDIKNALVGSAMNGNKGVVKQLNEIDTRVEDLEDFKGEVHIYVKQAKFVVGAIVIIMLGILAKLFNLK